MLKFMDKVERGVIYSLLVMILSVIVVSTLEVAIYLVQQLTQPPLLMLDVTRLLDIFSLFMMVLIALELLHSVKGYITHRRIPVEEVFLISMIALARKVIVLDVKASDAFMLIGLGVLLLALAIGYYLVKRAETFKTD
jgi:uncharacterized membrane protein (DUF373 family)